jgi:hypothetical protein
MVVPEIADVQTCRIVSISHATSQLGQAPVTYVAGGDTSVLSNEHVALLVAWYEERLSEVS